MKCPVDNATLLLSERQGVEIDYCPECRGVWLDRGELDKLVERADDREQRSSRPDRGSYQPKAKKKKGGWLSEIFEME